MTDMKDDKDDKNEENVKKYIRESLSNLRPGWVNLFTSDPIKPALLEIFRTLKARSTDWPRKFTPEPKNIFESFKYMELKDVKIVLLGQDPYIKRGEATGLSFSVKPSVTIPPSLKRIFECLKTNKFTNSYPKTGDLTSWAKDGVLMLNAHLTTEFGTSNAHMFWEPFTNLLINRMCELRKDDPLIFILWGGFAQKKERFITKRNCVLKWGHPSPLGDNGRAEPDKFKNCDNFIKANRELIRQRKNPINWGMTETKSLSEEIKLRMFTDGSARKNGKPGAIASYAYFIPDLEKKCAGSVCIGKYDGNAIMPSNQRGELLGIIEGLEYLIALHKTQPIEIVTDSMYCKGIIESWLKKWKKENTIHEKKNVDLLERLDFAMISYGGTIKVKHVNSHIPEPKESNYDDSLSGKAKYGEDLVFWGGNDLVDKMAQKINDDCQNKK
jgi:uracil-DNA glycosylase